MQVIILNDCTAEEAIKVINETKVINEVDSFISPRNSTHDNLNEDEELSKDFLADNLEVESEEAPVVVKKTRNRKKKEEIETAPVVTELTPVTAPTMSPEQMFSIPAPASVQVETPAQVVTPVTAPTMSPEQMFSIPTPVTAQVQAVVAAPVQEQPSLYDNVFERIRNAFQAGKIGNEYVNMTVKEINGIFGLNVTGFHELKNYPEAIKHVHGSLIQKGL